MMQPASQRETPSGEDALRRLRLQLAGLLRCSETMLVHAQLGDWNAVEALERERRAELEGCLEQALRVDESPLITEAVATLMHLNEQLVGLVRQAREQVLVEGRRWSRGRSAARLYGEDGTAERRE